jgi:hypothetical protein
MRKDSKVTTPKSSKPIKIEEPVPSIPANGAPECVHIGFTGSPTPVSDVQERVPQLQQPLQQVVQQAPRSYVGPPPTGSYLPGLLPRSNMQRHAHISPYMSPYISPYSDTPYQPVKNGPPSFLHPSVPTPADSNGTTNSQPLVNNYKYVPLPADITSER